MSQLASKLGYDHYSVVEVDYFTRIRDGHFMDNEEARYDTPSNFVNGYAYVGVAEAGSPLGLPVWHVIRISFDGRGRKVREQYRTDVAWIDRAEGWI